VRVYLPATLPLLAGWLRLAGAPAGVTGFAVTPGLRESDAEGDAEELEWAASVLAGRASLRLLAGDDDVAPLDHLEPGAVRLGVGVGVPSWAAGLVDDPGAAPVIAAAADVVDAADLGDDDAEFAVGEAEDAELAWWAAQELPGLVNPTPGER